MQQDMKNKRIRAARINCGFCGQGEHLCSYYPYQNKEFYPGQDKWLGSILFPENHQYPNRPKQPVQRSTWVTVALTIVGIALATVVVMQLLHVAGVI